MNKVELANSKRIMENSRQNLDRGFIIIFSFIILVFLIGISIAFLVISKTSQKDVNLFKLRLKSEYSAHSGVELSIAKLKEYFMGRYLTHPLTNWLYFGEDFNRDYELGPAEDLNDSGFLNINSLPIEKAIFPSIPNLTENSLTIDGKPYYVSGILERGSFGTVAYRIKILDNSQRIYYKLPTIKLLLNNLKEILPKYDPLISKLEYFIVERKFEYETVLRNLDSENERIFFKEFFTNYTYMKEMVQPSPSINKNQMIKSFKDIWRDMSFSYEQRAPININNCRPEILYALFANIKGLYIDLDDKNSSPFTKFLTNLRYEKGSKFIDRFVKKYTSTPSIINLYFDNKSLNPPSDVFIGTVKEYTITSQKARYLARDILDKREEEKRRASVGFETFEIMWEFLNDLIRKVPNDYNYHDMHLLWANIYPKIFVNWFNPNYYTYREFSKIDLTDYTTEVILGPGGYFDIEAEGVVIIADKVEARATNSATVKIFDIYSDYTQDDFEKGEVKPVNIVYSKEPFKKSDTNISFIPLKAYPFGDNFKNLKKITGYLSLNISDYDNLNGDADILEGNYITNPQDTISNELNMLFNKKFNDCSIELEKENNVKISAFYEELSSFQKNRMFSGGVSFWIKPQFLNYGYNKIAPSPICGTISYYAINKKKETMPIINEFGYIFLDDEDLFLVASTNPVYDTLMLTDDMNKESQNDFKLPPKTWTHIALLWGNPKHIEYNKDKKEYFYNDPDKFIRFFVNNEEVTKTVNPKKTMPIIGSVAYDKTSNLQEFLLDSDGDRLHWIVEDAPFEFTISKIRTDIKNDIDIMREYVNGIYFNGEKPSFFTSREFRIEKPSFFGSISWHGYSFSQAVENLGNFISVINMQLLDENKNSLFGGEKTRITDPRGIGKFNIMLKNAFYYRAYFDLTILDNNTMEPILNPPVLDEVTIVLIPVQTEYIKPVQ